MDNGESKMSEEFLPFFGGVFSQWFRTPFDIDGVTYNCAEQWMMACKARHFGDEATLKRIMKAGHPADQKRLGRTVVDFKVEEWNRVARDYVYQGNYAKFTQDPELLKCLLNTRGTTLV
ncbi:MAG: NADAR family protein, partial [Minisyncoccia bacterium]